MKSTLCVLFQQKLYFFTPGFLTQTLTILSTEKGLLDLNSTKLTVPFI